MYLNLMYTLMYNYVQDRWNIICNSKALYTLYVHFMYILIHYMYIMYAACVYVHYHVHTTVKMYITFDMYKLLYIKIHAARCKTNTR